MKAHSSDTVLAIGGSEVDGDLSDHLLSSQANLTVLTKEIGGIDIGPDNDNEITKQFRHYACLWRIRGGW